MHCILCFFETKHTCTLNYSYPTSERRYNDCYWRLIPINRLRIPQVYIDCRPHIFKVFIIITYIFYSLISDHSTCDNFLIICNHLLLYLYHITPYVTNCPIQRTLKESLFYGLYIMQKRTAPNSHKRNKSCSLKVCAISAFCYWWTSQSPDNCQYPHNYKYESDHYQMIVSLRPVFPAV